jgi:hypothetical protein
MAILKNSSKLLEIPVRDEYDSDINFNNPTFNKLIKHINKDSWYYNNKKIYYKHNEYGYRSDNLSDINDNDYILTFGCSYSYGVGLFYEDTYSYKLANELNLKNINLAIGGSGISEQFYNTILFNTNFTNIRLPKYVIYQYPNDYRVSLSKTTPGEESVLGVLTMGVNKNDYTSNEYINEYYIKNSGEKKLKDLLFPLYLNNIWESLGVPVFHITFNDYIQELKSDYQTFDIINIKDDSTSLYDKARDLSHNGIKFHDKVKEIILNKIKNG